MVWQAHAHPRVGWVRKSQCQCMHQISGSEGQACEVRGRMLPGSSVGSVQLQETSRYDLDRVQQSDKMPGCQGRQRVTQSMRGDLTRARLKNPTTVQIKTFSVLVFWCFGV